MKRFCVPEQTSEYDVYQKHVLERTWATFALLPRQGVVCTFETLAGMVQKAAPAGFAPGQPEIALDILLLVQAGLVEAI